MAKAPSDEVNATSAGTRQSKELQLVNVTWADQIQEFEDDVKEEEYEKYLVSAEEDIKIVNNFSEQQLAIQTPKKSKLVSPDQCQSEKIVGDENISLLEDPEIFILDMGATMHSTGNSCGITNMKAWHRQKRRDPP